MNVIVVSLNSTHQLLLTLKIKKMPPKPMASWKSIVHRRLWELSTGFMDRDGQRGRLGCNCFFSDGKGHLSFIQYLFMEYLQLGTCWAERGMKRLSLLFLIRKVKCTNIQYSFMTFDECAEFPIVPSQPFVVCLVPPPQGPGTTDLTRVLRILHVPEHHMTKSCNMEPLCLALFCLT